MATNIDQHVGSSGSFFHLPYDSLDLIAGTDAHRVCLLKVSQLSRDRLGRHALPIPAMPTMEGVENVAVYCILSARSVTMSITIARTARRTMTFGRATACKSTCRNACAANRCITAAPGFTLRAERRSHPVIRFPKAHARGGIQGNFSL